MSERIHSFLAEYNWLSNFYPSHLIVVHGEQWHSVNTVEHAYQASKCLNEDDWYNVCTAWSPGAAKRLGRRVLIRPDWEQVKVPVMNSLLCSKFGVSSMLSSERYEMAKKLIATGDAELIEGNWWHDNFWGSCKCIRCGDHGQNMLGKLLMDIRTHLQGNGTWLEKLAWKI